MAELVELENAATVATQSVERSAKKRCENPGRLTVARAYVIKTESRKTNGINVGRKDSAKHADINVMPMKMGVAPPTNIERMVMATGQLGLARNGR